MRHTPGTRQRVRGDLRDVRARRKPERLHHRRHEFGPRPLMEARGHDEVARKWRVGFDYGGSQDDPALPHSHVVITKVPPLHGD
eukprot:1851727-Pyramimonas_sp.AAC.1